MRIGIDLRALQTGHKYRGIGEVAKQTTNRILSLASQDNIVHNFIFYEYDNDDPKLLLSIPANIQYEVVKLGDMPEFAKNLTRLDKMRRHMRELYGEPIRDSRKSDVFLQFDYAFGVPRNTKTILIKHDLIPYIFWDKFFESPLVPLKNKAVRTSLRTAYTNARFKRILARSLKSAHVILAVSESTKKDVEKYFHTKPSKTKVALLGVNQQAAKTDKTETDVTMPTKPYLLFVGAGDARRSIEDAIAAFNNLKAEGYDIQFVLVGENFKSPKTIPNIIVRNAVLTSSYKQDILTMGYIDDTIKQKLYKAAIAFVYPTQYEGFGIPVLESMLLECPIVSYKNSSIPEVGGEYAYYANNWSEMKQRIEEILALSTKENTARKKAARQYAEQFTWDRTAEVIYSELINVGK